MVTGFVTISKLFNLKRKKTEEGTTIKNNHSLELISLNRH